jgi:hypothetical protein
MRLMLRAPVIALFCSTVSYNLMADHPSVAFGSEANGPINTIPATVMPVGKLAIGFRNEWINRDAFSDEALETFAEQGVEDVHSIDVLNSASISATYGLTTDLTISARLPWVTRDNIREGELEDGVGEAHSHGSTGGLGDLVVLANYRTIESKNLDVSIQLGFKAPSGDTNASDDDDVLETEFQPGSGSWDLLFGAAVSRTVGRWGLHANVLFDLTTEGSQDAEFGDSLSYNVAAVYALSPNDDSHHGSHRSSHPHVRWDAMLEINGESRWKNAIAGELEANSGATTVFISPGLRASYQDIGFFVSVGLPIVEDSNGVQTDADFRLVGGLSFSF